MESADLASPSAYHAAIDPHIDASGAPRRPRVARKPRSPAILVARDIVTGLEANWQARIEAGELRSDPGQRAVLSALSDLSLAIARTETRWPFARRKPARGVYVWGGVGGGKSALMQAFHDMAPTRHKQRLHFHEFMGRAHELIAQWRRRRRDRRRGAGDPVPAAARLLCTGTRLLCFDEFHVTDIADAMLLGRLFEHVFGYGVTIVATSNRHPDDLYADGLNRDLFLPFIAMLKEHMRVVELRAACDYRLRDLGGRDRWYAPATPETRALIERLWRDILADREQAPVALSVRGRTVDISRAAGGYARLTFEELCARPLGAADYRAVADRFPTLIVEDIPVLAPERRNEAARFVTLIDTLYEARTRLIATAEAEPGALYRSGDGAFEFERTASRLQEMRRAGFARAVRRDSQSESPA